MKGLIPRGVRGFTLLELMMVVAIVGVIAIIAVPKMTNVIATAKLRASMTSLSGLMQNTRMMAVQQNKIKSAHIDGGGTTSRLVGYVKDAGDGSSYTTRDIQVEMEAPISKLTTPTGTGAPAAIAVGQLGFTAQTGDVSFNSRGLPCAFASGTCTTNVGFVYYFKDNRISGSNAWAAVSISPAGRINRWFYNGASWVN